MKSMSENSSVADQELASLEREIKEKIDEIFENEISGHRFVQSSSNERQPGLSDAVVQELMVKLRSFHDSLSAERQKLKALLDKVPYPDDLKRMRSKEVSGKIFEMAGDLKGVGKNIGRVLDRLLLFIHHMLEMTADRS
jgi:hypothetical protein